MTRKTALKEAITIIKSSEIDKNKKENIIKCLELCIEELPFAKWTKEAIFDACDQFIEDNGRPLILNDFVSKDLPSHPTIKNRFGITLKEFRDLYYPLPKKKARRPENIIEEFRKEYLRCGAKTRQEYNKLRNKSLPCATTVIRLSGIDSWAELMTRAGIHQDKKTRESSIKTSAFSFKNENI